MAKFFFAVSSPLPERQKKAEELLVQQVGKLDLSSDIYCFSEYTNYYDSEFGGECWKYFVSADLLRSAEDLVPIKLAAEEIQIELARDDGTQRRTVNIDPGYINGWQVVLSTVKNHSHRIYLAGGVFAEITLLYRKSGYVSMPWTYADYKSSQQQEFLKRVRSRYMEQKGGETSFTG